MKQGAGKTVADWKAEPKARAVHPGAVDQQGQSLAFKGDPLINGPGYHADAPPRQAAGPGGGRQVHKSGSQGRH